MDALSPMVDVFILVSPVLHCFHCKACFLSYFVAEVFCSAFLWLPFGSLLPSCRRCLVAPRIAVLNFTDGRASGDASPCAGDAHRDVGVSGRLLYCRWPHVTTLIVVRSPFAYLVPSLPPDYTTRNPCAAHAACSTSRSTFLSSRCPTILSFNISLV